MDACEDNYLNQFFNAFGEMIDTSENVNLSQQSSQDNDPIPNIIEDASENIKPIDKILHVQSQEGSDVESAKDLISSGEHNKDMPDEFKHDERPKGMKYTKTSINYYKFLSMKIEHKDKYPGM